VIAVIVPSLLGLALMAVWVYALVDLISTDEVLIRNLPRLPWLLIVVFLWVIGAFLWFALGRPAHAGLSPGARHARAPGKWRDDRPQARRRPRGPEDDDGWTDFRR
jgi:hypothetical protein